MDRKELRGRIVEEDTLVGSRTVSFLLANGFLIASFGLSELNYERAAIGFMGICISLIWLSIGWQSRKAITALHELYHEKFPNDEINKAVFEKIMWKRKIIGTTFGPTELITFWLPLVVLATWVSLNYNLYQ